MADNILRILADATRERVTEDKKKSYSIKFKYNFYKNVAFIYKCGQIAT